MIGLVSLRWVLTVAFAAGGAYHLGRLVRAQPAEHRISETLHLIMGAAMVAMVWPWGARLPQAVWATVFTLSTAWFVASAAWSPGRRLGPASFAAAAMSMVWMGTAPVDHHPPAHHHPGMAMAGPGLAGWISGGLGLGLVAVAGWWVVRGMRLGALPAQGAEIGTPNWSALCHGLMSAGMGLSLLAMT